ncbi:MAG: NAD(P)(+) transhydrogenase (Re/Si-specific) subunit beta [Planctomycetes bacterium]|nr:NAD(P)(+) transhydrogenase (Re/Si-specific) subunit beta [Planctomycetota bacterium]
MERAILDLAYLVAALCFITGLKRMSGPKTARAGNTLSAFGMLIAIVATLCEHSIVEYWQIGVGALIGGAIGAIMVKRVQMTSMPQLVAVLHGFGSAAAGLVAAAELVAELAHGGTIDPVHNGIIQFTAILSSLTVAGSFVAYGKLEEKITGRAVDWPMRHPLNALLLLGLLAIGAYLVHDPTQMGWFVVLNVGAALLGVLLVLSIGGADMPVVVSVLNSYAGIAGALAGFVIDSTVLIITGALVGASGMILSRIMCKAMNRSLANVLFGSFGGDAAKGPAGATITGTIRSTTAEDAAQLLAYSGSVVIVPGYGLAVAQAQHQVSELAQLLEKRGVDVKYAIHPVAGRMPGHMNVLLAEANVPYDKLVEMERINGELDRTDVVLVIGANDVVNPAARSNPQSPIYGMPILDVDKSKNIIVMKRGMNPGFAGIENELFYNPRTRMLFGDAKASLTKLVEETKAIE